MIRVVISMERGARLEIWASYTLLAVPDDLGKSQTAIPEPAKAFLIGVNVENLRESLWHHGPRGQRRPIASK